MEKVACNLCGCTDAEIVYTLPDYLLGREDVSATFVKCNSCGLIYQNPRPTLEEMAIHYPPAYESYAPEPDGENASWLLRQAIQYGIAKRWRFVTRHKHAGRLLDVGCATGTFLRGMQSRGNWELYGVEINEHAARIARERYGLNVRVGTLERAEYPNGFFDAVTLWDVLEHLHNPAASLREIHRVLKRDGILLIRSPNLRSWDAALFGCFWSGWDAPRHLFVFEPSTLRRLLRTGGFSVLDTSCRSGEDVMFHLSLRFLVSAQRTKAAGYKILIRLLQNPVIRLTLAPVFFLGGLGTRGPLMVVTAKAESFSDDRDSSYKHD